MGRRGGGPCAETRTLRKVPLERGGGPTCNADENSTKCAKRDSKEGREILLGAHNLGKKKNPPRKRPAKMPQQRVSGGGSRVGGGEKVTLNSRHNLNGRKMESFFPSSKGARKKRVRRDRVARSSKGGGERD